MNNTGRANGPHKATLARQLIRREKVMSRTSSTHNIYRVYAVERRRSSYASWTDIGAAFTHPDGKGFDLELQSMPLSAAELVVRTAAERIRANGAPAFQTTKRSAKHHRETSSERGVLDHQTSL